MIVGDNDFISEVKKKCLDRSSEREQPSYRDLMAEAVESGVVFKCVAEILRLDPREFYHRLDDGIARGFDPNINSEQFAPGV